jgi:hypothetical protein
VGSGGRRRGRGEERYKTSEVGIYGRKGVCDMENERKMESEGSLAFLEILYDREFLGSFPSGSKF